MFHKEYSKLIFEYSIFNSGYLELFFGYSIFIDEHSKLIFEYSIFNTTHKNEVIIHYPHKVYTLEELENYLQLFGNHLVSSTGIKLNEDTAKNWLAEINPKSHESNH
jgi:hypothetical protein